MLVEGVSDHSNRWLISNILQDAVTDWTHLLMFALRSTLLDDMKVQVMVFFCLYN